MSTGNTKTLKRGLFLATRDVSDFEHCGIEVINPWEAGT